MIAVKYSTKVTAALVVAGLLLFGASVTHPFHFDDALIANDSNVTNPSRWFHFFNPLHLRQLTFFSFYLNHLLGGLDPAGYHIVNVALHIANAVLLFYLLSRFVEDWIAVGAAALFLVHPIQTEAVLYIYERSTLLACFFSLLGLIAWVRGKPWPAALMFVLAFEGKESALAAPLLVALLSFPKTVKTKFGMRTGIALAVAALSAATLFLLVGDKTVGISAGVSPFRYLLTETRVAFTYLRLLVFPVPQSLEYDFHNAGGLLSVAGILIILIVGWLLRRRVEGLCVLAFFILLAPTSSIIPSADAAFEHRLYMPMAAFSLLVASLVSRIPRRTAIGAAVLTVLAVLSIRRENVWASDITLWQDTARHAPLKARVWFNLGGAYLNTDPAKARDALMHAVALEPVFPQAYYDLGIIEQRNGNWDVALADYQRATEQKPDYWPAWNNMGNTLFAMRQSEKARECFERTLSLNPDYWPAQYNLALIYFQAGRFDQAIRKLKIVLDWQPDFRDARQLLATSLNKAGYAAEADRQLKKVGESPGHPPPPGPISAPNHGLPWRDVP
jgi:tetratricopeptide (TPR) repeat protein